LGGRRFLEDEFDTPLPIVPEPACHLVLIPYEETTTYRRGTRAAPEAIVEASSHVELFDESLRVDATLHGVETLRPPVTDLRSITACARRLRADHPRSLLGFLGGEHSITPALVAGCCEGEFGVVWIDAHADLRESYLGKQDNHACAGFHTARLAPMVQIGVRTLAREEAEFLAHTDRVRAFTRWGEDARKAVEALPRNLYLTVDVDGFSPELVRAVGTPEPGGLHWEEVLDIIKNLFREKSVIAFDVVELCPDERDIASTFTIAKLVYKIISHHAYYTLGG